METPKKRKNTPSGENVQQTPPKKPREEPQLKGFTPIKDLTGFNKFVGPNGRMTLAGYVDASVVNFLFSTGLEEKDVKSVVYGVVYNIDGKLFFKIGYADVLSNTKTPFGTKSGRLCSTLRDLNGKFDKVRIEKIHFVIQDNPDRDIYKLLIEAFMLKSTKSSMVNPGADIGLNLKEFRSMKNVAEYRTLAEKVLKEHNLRGAVLQSP